MNEKLDKVIDELTNNRDRYTMGEAIRKVRKSRGWQQKGLAEKSGISNTYLCDIEKNRTTPSLKTIRSVGNALLDGVKGLDWKFFCSLIT